MNNLIYSFIIYSFLNKMFYTFAHLKRRLNDKKIYKYVKIWL